MKKNFILFVSLLLSLLVTAQSDTSLCDYSGCIGDVKYSILKLDSFRKINGSGWILLNGNLDAQTDSLFKISVLNKVFQIPSLPDARGVFIRGMNIGRDTATGDSGGNRKVGDSQKDQYLRHQHSFKVGDGGGDGPGVQVVNNNIQEEKPHLTINSGGGAETRPRNIALYIYIKIN